MKKELSNLLLVILKLQTSFTAPYPTLVFKLKRLFSLLLVLIVILSSCGSKGSLEPRLDFQNIFYEDYQNDDFNPNEIILSFAALSDSHIGGIGQEEKLDRVLGLLHNKSEYNLVAIMIAGDLTDTSGPEKRDDQIIALKGILDKHINNDTSFVYCLGVYHDHNPTDIANNVLLFRQLLGKDLHKNEILEEEDHDKGKRHYIIKGFHFLSLDYDDNLIYSKEKVQWLDNTLKEITEKEANKPVFLSIHVPEENQLTEEILSKYPQLILFTGHTHLPFNTDKAISQNTYTHLHCGGLHYYRQYGPNKSEVRQMGVHWSFAQGYLIEVDSSNNVRAIRLDLRNDSYYLPEWIIPYPKEDKSHLRYMNLEEEASPPSLEGQALNLKEEDNILRVSFSKGIDGSNPIEFYALNFWQLIDGQVINNAVNISSQYSLLKAQDRPEKFDLSFPLESDIYTVTVTAYDCFLHSNSLFYNQGLNLVIVELEDNRISLDINGASTLIAPFLPGQRVGLNIKTPTGYTYKIESIDVNMVRSTFNMPDNNVIIRITLIER